MKVVAASTCVTIFWLLDWKVASLSGSEFLSGKFVRQSYLQDRIGKDGVLVKESSLYGCAAMCQRAHCFSFFYSKHTKSCQLQQDQMIGFKVETYIFPTMEYYIDKQFMQLCSEGWRLDNWNCYFTVNQKMDYQSAEDYCKSLLPGGQLLDIYENSTNLKMEEFVPGGTTTLWLHGRTDNPATCWMLYVPNGMGKMPLNCSEVSPFVCHYNVYADMFSTIFG